MAYALCISARGTGWRWQSFCWLCLCGWHCHSSHDSASNWEGHCLSLIQDNHGRRLSKRVSAHKIYFLCPSNDPLVYAVQYTPSMAPWLWHLAWIQKANRVCFNYQSFVEKQILCCRVQLAKEYKKKVKRPLVSLDGDTVRMTFENYKAIFGFFFASLALPVLVYLFEMGKDPTKQLQNAIKSLGCTRRRGEGWYWIIDR